MMLRTALTKRLIAHARIAQAEFLRVSKEGEGEAIVECERACECVAGITTRPPVPFAA